MRILRSRAAVAVVVGAFILGGCGGGGGPASLPSAMSPTVAQRSMPAAQSADAARHKRHPRDVAACTTTPVTSPQVTPTSLTLAPNGSGQFAICTQYSTVYKLTASPAGVVTFPVSVTPTVQPNSVKAATVTVNAGASCGSTTITIKDKKGKTATVSVTVTGCLSSPQTFTYTAPGGVQTFTVPSGVTQITVDAVGASGAAPGGYSTVGGLGWEVKATLPVTAGNTLYVYVGGAGSGTVGGFNGGGADYSGYNGSAGGASDVRTANDLSDRVIIAGGGGGAGYEGNGGNAGAPGGSGTSGGGDGGLGTGGGGGGTQSSGGPGGNTCCGYNAAVAGVLGIGGGDDSGGGGGGGGYYGGGSGGTGAGGGGGSSYIGASATHVSDNVATSGQCDVHNNGCITISW